MPLWEAGKAYRRGTWQSYKALYASRSCDSHTKSLYSPSRYAFVYLLLLSSFV